MTFFNNKGPLVFSLKWRPWTPENHGGQQSKKGLKSHHALDAGITIKIFFFFVHQLQISINQLGNECPIWSFQQERLRIYTTEQRIECTLLLLLPIHSHTKWHHHTSVVPTGVHHMGTKTTSLSFFTHLTVFPSLSLILCTDLWLFSTSSCIHIVELGKNFH